MGSHEERAAERAALRVEQQLGETHANVLELAAQLTSLAELLVERGLLDRAELDLRLDTVRAGLRASSLGEGPPVRLGTVSDKRTAANQEVDCEAQIPLCKGACCGMQVTLSLEDVEEGKLRWDLADPYALRRGADGRCSHQDRTTRFCGAYEERPAPCRGYSCEGDRRIWRDFASRVPNEKGIAALLSARAERPLVLLGRRPTLPPR